MHIAKTNKNSSSLIYACLDCRIALEILDLTLILASVNNEERLNILEDSKPKNGIDKLNRKKGSLKHKYQQFIQAFFEIIGVENKYYNFKKSKEFQHELSKYIHSYYMNNDDLLFNSEIMQKSISIIEEVDNFIISSLPIINGKYRAMNVVIENIPKVDKDLLAKWKISSTMEYEDLKKELQRNIKMRNQ